MLLKLLTRDYFAAAKWPAEAVDKIVLPLSDNLASRAARIIAVGCYSKNSELAANGPAHRFYLAMMAWMCRAQKNWGHMDQLPQWASSIKWQQIRGRCSAGERRLRFQLVSYLTITESLLAAAEQDQIRDGVVPGFGVRFSEDFSSAHIVFQPHTERMLPELWNAAKASTGRRGDTRQKKSPPSQAGSINPSLRSAILRHRKAFAVPTGDAVAVAKNIYNRRISACFPVFHIVSVLHQALLDAAAAEKSRNESPVQSLLMSPGWAKAAPEKVALQAPLAVDALRRLGIRSCDCRLVGFRSAQ